MLRKQLPVHIHSGSDKQGNAVNTTLNCIKEKQDQTISYLTWFSTLKHLDTP